ncbi:GDSL esterase/lipase At5g14450-like [Bidens hawaiensis]|uniref:GDSL esterase/lipase At5g14450-like n=1 Tax=Bidens hawaiensis TaxID=980011 RepID=UPI00404B87B6
MDFRTRNLTIAIGALLVATYSIFTVFKEARIQNINNNLMKQESSCFQVPAIYNFSDSNSDTGADAAVFGPLLLPYGMTYFHKPSGRLSDGRLTIDFIAEKLGLPYLSAYVDSIGTNFRHGANFAVSGATIQPADALMLNKTFNSLTLPVQLSQFQQFKRRASDLYLEESSEIKDRLPRPEDYPRALYTFDIGQNDLHAGITKMKEQDVKKYIPTMINYLSSTIKKLYEGGARTFWIINTGPIGCLPFFVKNYPPAPGNADEVGCVESYNKLAQEFNKQLEDEVSKLAMQLQESSFMYFDVYSLKYSLISEPNKHGFTDPLGQCLLWEDVDVKKACDNPLEYINWDGIHYTEAANKWVADHLQDGFVNASKIPLTESCLPVSGSHR